MTDVFISYAKADSDIADQIATKLQQNNVSVFMDRESLVSGESSSQKTINELEHSRVVFVILTKLSSFEMGQSRSSPCFTCRCRQNHRASPGRRRFKGKPGMAVSSRSNLN